jgi:hypothetical protein
MPQRHKAALLSAFKGTESTWYPGWFYVHSGREPWSPEEHPTDKWLTKKFGLHSDQPIFRLGDSFRVMFCWYTQSWIVSA